jgi:hypothetical protein
MVSESEAAFFATFGFVVLRGELDPGPLSDELDRALDDGCGWSPEPVAGTVGVDFRYVPMMGEATPVSMALLDRLAAVASSLLGSPVLPVRAKGVRYLGEAHWHRDSDQPVKSVGLACYLEPLDADTGALRVLPGSHRPVWGASVSALLDSSPTLALPGHVVDTDPGDVIVFDEHLFHASAGGRDRRQWRVDYVEDPDGPEAEARVRAYYAGVFPPRWDGGYDVDRYPTYGPHWRAGGRPWVRRLEQLGAYEAAGAQEAFTRARRAG